MLGIFAAAAVLSCAVPVRGDLEIARLSLDAGGGRLLKSYTFKHLGDGPLGISAVRIAIYSPNCAPLFEQTFTMSSDIKLAIARLGNASILVVTAMSPGGSGCGLQHVLIDYSDNLDPFVISPMKLFHDNMGGLFVGDLGRGKGPGLVTYNAIWNSGNHYDPHPYRVTTYLWTHEAFAGPATAVTKAVSPDPAKAARTLGLPFSDNFTIAC